MNSQSTIYYHKNKARLTLLEAENAELKVENGDVKATLVHERQWLEALMERNEQLEHLIGGETLRTVVKKDQQGRGKGKRRSTKQEVKVTRDFVPSTGNGYGVTYVRCPATRKGCIMDNLQ